MGEEEVRAAGRTQSKEGPLCHSIVLDTVRKDPSLLEKNSENSKTFLYYYLTGPITFDR